MGILINTEQQGVDADPGTPEQITISTGSSASSGTITINCNGGTEQALAYNASGDDVETALAAVYGDKTFTAQGGPLNAFAIIATCDTVGDISDLSMTHDYTDGSHDVSVTDQGESATGGTNEIQKVIVSGAWEGTYQLMFSYDGNTATTSGLQWDANSAQVQSALEALSTIGSGNVSVTGAYNTGFYVEFVSGKAAKSLSEMSALSWLLEGSVGVIVVES